jgi:hypothetical protein
VDALGRWEELNGRTEALKPWGSNAAQSSHRSNEHRAFNLPINVAQGDQQREEGTLPDQQDLLTPGTDGSRAATDVPNGDGSSEEVHITTPMSAKREVELGYSLGGSFAEIRLQGRKRKTPYSHGRGGRSKISGYSKQSRLRFSRMLASIPRDSSALFITVTTPEGLRVDSAATKQDLLGRFIKRLERRFGEHPLIWRLEFGQRPEPHFHFIMVLNSSLPISKTKLEEIRAFVARAWYEVCGRVSEAHLRSGTRVERPRSLVRTMQYIAKAESPQNSTDSGELTPQHVGRRWGVWRKELLPIVWVETRVSLEDAFQARRILRRMLGLKNRAGVVTFSVFVRDEHIKRLLTLLGYPAPGRGCLAYGPEH